MVGWLRIYVGENKILKSEEIHVLKGWMFSFEGLRLKQINPDPH
jgi:hypothetical protein